MAEELQHLIDRIQKEAVDTAEKQSEQLTAQAKQKAAAMVKEAEEKARMWQAQAEVLSSLGCPITGPASE